MTRRLLAALFLTVVVAPTTLTAQDRNALILEARDEFDPGRAMELLSEALNPDLGPSDSLWGVGVQLMGQLLIDEGRDSLAGVWLRWGLRIDPGMVANDFELTTETIAALESARSRIVQEAVPDSVVRTEWTWGQVTPAGNGEARLGRDQSPASLQVVAVGFGILTNGTAITLPAGTYTFRATANGFQSVDVIREVLPGATTVLGFDLPLPVIAATPDSALADGVEEATLGRIVRVTSSFLDQSVCGTGVVAGRQGLILTTYETVRGAEAIAVQMPDGTRHADVPLAAYDVSGNVAVLRVPEVTLDSATLGDPAEGQFVWRASHTNCQIPSLGPNRVASVDGTIALDATSNTDNFGGPLIDNGGAIVGLLGLGDVGVPADALQTILGQANSNAAAQALTPATEVARVERHRYGAVRLSSTVLGGRARISPEESWHWPQLERTEGLPYTFAGPEGRYRIALVANGVTEREYDVTVLAGVTDALAMERTQEPQRGPQVSADGGGGGFPVAVLLLLAAGGGGAAFLLAGGGGEVTPPPTSQTGGIIISFPSNP